MRSALSFVAVAWVSVSAMADRAWADGQAARPQGVVYLQRSAVFDVPYGKDQYSVYRGPLLREIQRQALLIAARDQLGLTTRDAWLGDWMPTTGENEPFEVVMSGNPPTLEVRRGFYPAKTSLWKQVPKIGAIPFQPALGSELTEMIDHRQWVVDAEALSRTAYVEALEKCGFQGKPNAVHNERGVPEEIEKNLAEMVFTSQFIAVRRLHELLRSDGESPARLGALVRGYANLGVLTEFHWHPEHKVFKARALLYAQRMVARDAHSPQALWHRAYALALTGLHLPALEDLAAAEQAWKDAKVGGRGVRPGWVDLIDALCRFDATRLKVEPTDARWSQLARLLRFLAVEMSGETTMKVAVGNEILPKLPECYRIHDGVCAYGGVRTGHRATTEWFQIVGRTLYPRLAAMPGLPEPVAKIVGDVSPAGLAGNISEEFQTRAAVTRALLESGNPQPAAGGKKENEKAPAADAGEPSWAALGLMIRELSFVQVWRRVDFEMNCLGMPPDQFQALAAPLVAGHPYADFIGTFTHDHPVRNAAWDRLRKIPQDGLEAQEWPIYDPRYRITRPDEDQRYMDVANTRIDLTANDLTHDLRLFDGNENRPCMFTRATERLTVISPHCPHAKAIGIDWFAKEFRDRIPEWEKEAAGHARLCMSLAAFYFREHQNWKQAAKWAQAALDANPDLEAAQLLAAAYWYQGKKDQWVSTLEEALNYPDYSLAHGFVCDHLARYFMSQKDWQKAMVYAEGAANTGAAWGLNLAAEIFEGTQRWEDADKVRKASTGNYSSGYLCSYFFCRRTGHGDVDAARAASKAEIASWDYPQRDPEQVAVFYVLEKNPKEAAKYMGEAYRRFHRFSFGLRLALLHDELKDTKARDELLKSLAAWQVKPGWPETQQEWDGLIGLPKMMAADLAQGGKGKLDLAAADRAYQAIANCLDAPPDRHNNAALVYSYLLGRYLSLHGKEKEAIGYWKKCVADTENMGDSVRTLAAVELYDRGIKPESYKALWEKDAQAKEKNGKAKDSP